MIVYLERPTCCGKSTLAKILSSSGVLPGISVSVVAQSLVTGYDEVTQRRHMARDEQKCAEAKNRPGDQLILVDRSFISTVVYNLTRAEVAAKYDPTPILTWWLRGLGSTLIRPDAYMYFEADLDACVTRANSIRDASVHNLWTREARRISDWYDILFRGVESSVMVLRLDARGNIATVVERAVSMLAEAVCVFRAGASGACHG